MEKIAAQNYDYNSMKETLNNVSDVVQDNLKESGEDIKDDMLGSNAVINATDKAAEYLPTAEEAEGFF